MLIRTFCLLVVALAAAAQSPVERLIETVRNGPDAARREALEKQYPKLENRGVASVWGQDYLFVAGTAKDAAVAVDGGSPAPLTRLAGTSLSYAVLKLTAGTTHAYQFFAGGEPLGPRADIAGYNPDSYPRPGVPAGKLSEKFTLKSRIYDGMTANYWIYAAAGVNPAEPAPLMVWQDGQTFINEMGGSTRLFTVNDNLAAQRLIPPMVHVLIEPGTSAEGRAMRSVEYDTVNDRYGRFLMEEVLPEVEKLYKLRPDGYSRAIGGRSSGAICAFNVAWFFNDRFTRVHSTIGSYTSIQWRPQEHLEGGNTYPFKVRKEPKRNIRVWLSDGYDDLENNHGSWPLQNIQMANSLKMMDYDFHFRFTQEAHNSTREAVDLPESLTWLWRGYDPAKTAERFELDPAEKAKPYYRVRIFNRDAW